MLDDAEMLLAIARLALEAAENFRTDLNELIHGVPADGELPEAWQTGSIAAGRLCKAVSPRGTVIGDRLFADQSIVVIDMSWCEETIRRAEELEELKEGSKLEEE
jgi:hypothetical protein